MVNTNCVFLIYLWDGAKRIDGITIIVQQQM